MSLFVKGFHYWCQTQRNAGIKGIYIYYHPHMVEAIGTDTWNYSLWLDFHKPINDNEAKS